MIRGTLDNQPVGVAGVRLGARVEARQSRVADYLWKKANGTEEGGESIALYARRRGGR